LDIFVFLCMCLILYWPFQEGMLHRNWIILFTSDMRTCRQTKLICTAHEIPGPREKGSDFFKLRNKGWLHQEVYLMRSFILWQSVPYEYSAIIFILSSSRDLLQKLLDAATPDTAVLFSKANLNTVLTRISHCSLSYVNISSFKMTTLLNVTLFPNMTTIDGYDPLQKYCDFP
jgi:hypothetical protein